ncbi:hypothetical protein PC120_g12203 [Phytophthora cactorum]|nr:hypothetical protein PC120_g12203 [Phytophthora cactorum]
MGIESANVLTELLAKADQAALVTMKMTNKNEQAVAAAHNNRVLAHTKRSLKRGCSGIAEVSMQSFNIYMPHAASANELNAPPGSPNRG